MTTFEDYGTIWVCVCCMLAHAADGCGCEGMNEDAHKRSRDERGRYNGGTVLGDGFPLSQITGSFQVAMGMRSGEHDDSCKRKCMCTHDADCEEHGDNSDQHHDQSDHDYPDDYECDCETNTFSTSQCEGCGSYLHGERHAMWLHKIKRPRRSKITNSN